MKYKAELTLGLVVILALLVYNYAVPWLLSFVNKPVAAATPTK